VSAAALLLVVSPRGEPEPLPEPDATAPAEVRTVLDRSFSTDECVRLAEAWVAVGEGLVPLGWSVGVSPGVVGPDCVRYYLDVAQQTVTLSYAQSPELQIAIEEVRAQLLKECLSEPDATELLRSEIERLGDRKYEIRTDGPVGGPPESLAAIEAHVNGGCTVYSGSGWGADGTHLYFLAGRS